MRLKSKMEFGVLGLLLVTLFASLCGMFDTHAAHFAVCATAPVALTDDEVKEFRTFLTSMKGDWADIKKLPEQLTAIKTENETLTSDIKTLRKQLLSRGSSPSIVRAGQVSIECARFLGAAFVVGNAKNGRLDLIESGMRERLFTESRSALGMEVKAAMSTTDIPLPVEYFGEVRDLISQFGVVRSRMMQFPIGMGTAKPPRFKTRPTFGSIAMSAAFASKNPQVEFAALESHKIGGIVQLPREIDEQSIVPMGQFLAKYGAVEFARAEDTWGFLADGTATYESVKGIVKIARDNSKTITLAAGKTAPSDATLNDFRNLRTKVNKAALSGKVSAYYLDTTWETTLRKFNTKDDLYVYIRLPDGSATLDGYPIVWTDVLTPYSETASPDTALAVFGALDYWWMGEKGKPRLDFSSDVYFATDELATRFIEEIDFDYQQVDVTAALLTAAA